VKLSPNSGNIGEFAKAAEGAGADALSVINTLVGMSVDVWTRKPRIATTTGGLSGPAIRPIALAMVYQCVRAVMIPVIGVGGIQTLQDVLEFLIVGASAVQIGTAHFGQPTVCQDLVGELEDYCLKQKIEKITDIIGTLQEIPKYVPLALGN
jgi:dihydroorotate dehydrogenase (NAD+) catalytic subunit